MRQIKFRAWSNSDERMLDNDYLKDYSYEDILYFYASDGCLMQFTSLHDKNGQEIYEGDIVVECYEDMFEDLGMGRIVSTICYEDGAFLLKNVGHRGNDILLLGDHCQGLEVIGNIYENQELLENA